MKKFFNTLKWLGIKVLGLVCFGLGTLTLTIWVACIAQGAHPKVTLIGSIGAGAFMALGLFLLLPKPKYPHQTHASNTVDLALRRLRTQQSIGIWLESDGEEN